MKNLNVIHIANITNRTVNSKYPLGQSQTPLPMSSERLIPSPLCIVRDTPPYPRFVRGTQTISTRIDRTPYTHTLSLSVSPERPSPAKSPGGSVVSWVSPPLCRPRVPAYALPVPACIIALSIFVPLVALFPDC